ncbi:esterase [Pseudoclavibacter sp. RFBJ3]|uniref:alpha/beta hydrolase fold domain-containing protein n=1 Tax=unclassified Pseudoclavibacter TaxID=2615177 RepID=UPI000CE77D59|nr:MULTISPECIES: alpha/beta hydrolase fold domain-containing protein [unclassified Pseudoclavibacter]PPF86535.1 esterase [Pseudoclavibacter sp. RFBJ5]PPF95268.1 esterase [Pseudoclavibacter sp. RFBJ3]PPF97702.1 esterase [Pseudoclavibacter sp. RFBH5]PPG22645.1 esterase [Pseudoclavibacter sp. RFBI4]
MPRRSPTAPHGVDATGSAVAGPNGPVAIRSYAPAASAARLSSSPVIWLHGGGFYSGGLDQPETHEVALALARARFEVTTVDYRLVTLGGRDRAQREASGSAQRSERSGRAPQSGRSARWERDRRPDVRFPVPLDDVLAVVEAVASRSGRDVVLGGASAGACLAAAAAYRLARAERSPVRGLFLTYGTFHAQLPPRSSELLSRLRGSRRFVHTPWLIGAMNLNYAGSEDVLLRPDAFPGGHNLTGFPPSLVVDADRDAMRASGSSFARELAAAGVDTEYRVIPGSAHAFLNRPRDPAFTRGIDLISEWMRCLD